MQTIKARAGLEVLLPRNDYLFKLLFGDIRNDVEEIHTLEIPRLPEQSDGSAVWDWTKFIGVRTEEELEMLAAKNETLNGAGMELYRLSAKDEVRLEYEAREKALKDYPGAPPAGRGRGYTFFQ